MKRWLAEHGAGLALGVRGMVAKELRARSRGWRPMWLLTFYLAGLTLGVAGFLALMSNAGAASYPQLGAQVFSLLVVGSVLLLAFITPALTVGAVSGERERRTLDLLLVTRASALGLVSGKLLASLVYVLYLLLASLPAFAVVYLFCGVPWHYLALALVVAAATAAGHAALGLFLSALLRRTALASVIAYLLVLLLTFGLPLGTALVGSASAGVPMGKDVGGPTANPPPVYLYASPLVAASSLLPTGSYLPVVGSLLALGGAGRYPPGYYPTTTTITSQGLAITQSVWITGSNPLTGQPQTLTTWAPWVYHLALSAGLAVLCLLGAGLAAAPIKPWQAWRARRGRRGRPVEVQPS